MSQTYHSLEELISSQSDEPQNKNHCSYSSILICAHMGVSLSSLITSSIILYILLSSLHTFSNVFSSFKENIHADVENFNNFLQVIPQLKEVLTIILNLCNSESIHPFCNNSTKQYIEL